MIIEIQSINRLQLTNVYFINYHTLCHCILERAPYQFNSSTLYFKTRDTPNAYARKRWQISVACRSEREYSNIPPHVAFSGVKVNGAICIAVEMLSGGGCGETDMNILLCTSTRDNTSKQLNDLNMLKGSNGDVPAFIASICWTTPMISWLHDWYFNDFRHFKFLSMFHLT